MVLKSDLLRFVNTFSLYKRQLFLFLQSEIGCPLGLTSERVHLESAVGAAAVTARAAFLPRWSVLMHQTGQHFRVTGVSR